MPPATYSAGTYHMRRTALILAAVVPALVAGPREFSAFAQRPGANAPVAAPSADPLTYADLADLALPAPLVVRARVRSAVRLKPEEAPGLAPGITRFYVRARTTSVLVGPPQGESISFLADVPSGPKGRAPSLAKQEVLVLAAPVPGRPEELQLVAPDAMIAWTPAREERLRAILTERNSPDAPPALTALREVLHVQGNLAGEGETQVFLATRNGAPVSLSIVRRPGQPPTWGVSFSEIVDQAARPPAPETLGWYRLACALPRQLPRSANISGSAEDRRNAAEDYALVLRDLGPCTRSRTLNEAALNAAPLPQGR